MKRTFKYILIILIFIIFNEKLLYSVNDSPKPDQEDIFAHAIISLIHDNDIKKLKLFVIPKIAENIETEDLQKIFKLFRKGTILSINTLKSNSFKLKNENGKTVTGFKKQMSVIFDRSSLLCDLEFYKVPSKYYLLYYINVNESDEYNNLKMEDDNNVGISHFISLFSIIFSFIFVIFALFFCVKKQIEKKWLWIIIIILANIQITNDILNKQININLIFGFREYGTIKSFFIDKMKITYFIPLGSIIWFTKLLIQKLKK